MSTNIAPLFLTLLVSYRVLTVCKAGDVFTYQHVTRFTGEDFCAVEDLNLFKNMCVHLATLHKYENYTIDGFENLRCSREKLNIQQASGAIKRVHPADILLLPCRFRFQNTAGPTASIIPIALGKGMEGTDVAEYSITADGWKPFQNRMSFLKNVRKNLVQYEVESA